MGVGYITNSCLTLYGPPMIGSDPRDIYRRELEREREREGQAARANEIFILSIFFLPAFGLNKLPRALTIEGRNLKFWPTANCIDVRGGRILPSIIDALPNWLGN